MARRYKKKNATMPIDAFSGVSELKLKCVCILNKLCLCQDEEAMDEFYQARIRKYLPQLTDGSTRPSAMVEEGTIAPDQLSGTKPRPRPLPIHNKPTLRTVDSAQFQTY